MFKLIFQSIESIQTDGTGRHTFLGVFQGNRAQTLAVFNGWFYWADDQKLWKAPQNLSVAKQDGFILKASLPVLNVYHALQQPQGELHIVIAFFLNSSVFTKGVRYTVLCLRADLIRIAF